MVCPLVVLIPGSSAVPRGRVIYLLAFFAGLTGAILAARAGYIRILDPSSSSPSTIATSSISAPFGRQRGAGSESTPDENATIGELVEALSVGTPESMQRLRAVNLKEREDYQQSVVPSLKREALRGLINRFVAIDWRDWPRANYNNGGRPTIARDFINNLLIVHLELGNYLETAAILIHRAYLSTSRGAPYDIRSDLRTVYSQSEQILSYRRRSGESTRPIVALEIDTDTIFAEFFAKVLSDLVARYIKDHPDQVVTILALLPQLDPQTVSAQFEEAITGFLRRVAVDGTPKLRDRVLSNQLCLELFKAIGKGNRGLRRTLAELYVVASLDALERGEQERSVEMLRDSAAIEPGLRSQILVGNYISQVRDKSEQVRQQIAQLEAVDEDQLKAELERAPTRPAKKRGSWWLWLGIPILIAVVYCAYRFYSNRELFDFPSALPSFAPLKRTEVDTTEQFTIEEFENQPRSVGEQAGLLESDRDSRKFGGL